MEIGNYIARAIESALELPTGWLDRNNSIFLKLTDEQCKLLTLAIDLPRSKQLALTTLLIQNEICASHLSESHDCLPA